MSKFFNTAGLCTPEKHYMVNPLKRILKVEQLIRNELYFTIHAPRQSGKTTYLYALAQKLNGEGKYIALVVSFERAGVGSMTLDVANETVMNAIYNSSTRQLEEKYRPENPGEKNFPDLYNYLHTWSAAHEKSVVLFIDEIDALMDDVLISILRQLRDGYQGRPKYFPSSVVLVGLRDVRDYRAKVRDDQKSMGTASPFNIKSESLLLQNFTKQEVFELLEQHTGETGQVFSEKVKEEVFLLSNGQPWLTNALANQIVSEILENDFSREITPDMVWEAKNQLILRRDTHLDSLIDKLKEERVKSIVQAIINGDNIVFDSLNENITYIRDLGIVSQKSPLRFANPIYAEIIPRVMASAFEESLPMEIETPFFVDKNNNLDMKKIMLAFQEFYRENAESWIDRFEFKESAHHLLMMAFLQRIVNSGGEITREMAVGNGRVDLLVKFNGRRSAVELKIKRGEQSIEKAKLQLSNYLDRLGLAEGYLVIFDPGTGAWEEKLYYRETQFNDKKIIMVGL
ncbi:MAG: AAA-like domain-containing protein [Candidatus Aminicenantes bacterium]|nr:AAA-like domain-containing protein [Candidatus Aminicenantes bacterium]